MAFDVQGARAAGYTDKEIADHLAAERKFDIAGARAAKYSDAELIAHLTAPQEAAPSQIPNTPALPQGAPTQPTPEDNLLGKIISPIDAGLSTLSAMVAAPVGAVTGLADSFIRGDGTPQDAAQRGSRVAEAMLYRPQTQTGREMVGAIGEAASALPPVVPIVAAEANAARAGAVAAGRAVADRSAAGLARMQQLAPQVAERVQRTLNRIPEAAPGTGARGSVGAAGTEMAAQRQQLADTVGIRPTQGQLTRDQQQLRFEQETAKGEQGAALRDRYSEQNEQFYKHFDHLVDQTGKQSADVSATGRSVDAAVRAKAARDKTEIRVAYAKADNSDEAAAPVTLGEVVSFLNESAPDQAVSKVLTAARGRAIQLGIAQEAADGTLAPVPTTVKNAERFRRAIGEATDYEPTNMRNAAVMKGLIDATTEPVAGPLYRQARRLRENYARQYENRGVISSLLNNKRGMDDRKVAIEDVFKHSILDASREEAAYVRRVLTAHPSSTPADVRAAGQQAWADLKGETVNWIKEQAFANTATDQRGNVILSVPKLNSAIQKLDKGGKLDLVFGKQGAQHMRDLNDLAKVIYTTPPGSVNTSNTASVLLAALAEAGVNGSMTGLPVPVLSVLRMAAIQVKNRRIQKRIEQALGQQRSRARTQQQPVRPAGATLH